MTDIELLAAAVQVSGLSKMRFASEVMGREYRTVRRWASGQSPMPKAARLFLEQYLKTKKYKA